jgi:hypothetical protein
MYKGRISSLIYILCVDLHEAFLHKLHTMRFVLLRPSI